MLDRLPTSVRDLLVAVLPVLLAWAGTDVLPILEGWNPLVAVAAAAVLTYITNWVTTWTRAYGVGATDNRPKD